MTSKPTMEDMSDAFQGLFRSPRLVYTALDESERSKDLWWKCTAADPVNSGLYGLSTPFPGVRSESDKALSQLLGREPFLAVLMCLPSTSDDDHKDDTADTAPEPIGFVVLNKAFPRSVAFGLALLPQYQGKGYGREAITWATDFAFDWGNMHRVAIGAASYNTRALHLYEDMGFTRDGCFRDCLYMNKQWHHLVEFSMLESEWPRSRSRSRGKAGS